MTTSSSHIPMRFGPSEVEVVRAGDGALILRTPHQLTPYPRAITDRLDHWAATAPERVFLAQRDRSGAWSEITFAGARALARDIAQGLVKRGLSPERPVAILSGNGLEHALIGLGAMYAGVQFASVSVAYSLIASDFGKLRAILGRLTPGLVFATSGRQFARALDAALPPDCEFVCSEEPPEGRAATALTTLWAEPAGPTVDAAHASVGPETVAKILFTSGSTGVPKGVINTQRMLTSNQAMIATSLPTLAEQPPVLLDWLPWSHTFGGNHNLGIALTHGGTFHIDDGKPLPRLIEETVRNLREVSPTAYFNVPKGYELLLPYLQAEPALAASLFRRLQFMFYAGAVLPPHVTAEYERLALAATGRKIPMITSLGSTETAPAALYMTGKANAQGVVGLPCAGVSLKLVPNAGKLEARVKGPSITPGYWREPELTAKAFDAEGYYLLGDALRFADAADPALGLVFDGRISEDFKLKTGTWVSVGPLRERFIAHFTPVARDIVIAGHDRDEVCALIVPDVDELRPWAGDREAALPADAVLDHPAVRDRLGALLASFNATAAGSSARIARAVLLSTAPSLDSGEMTDKGSLNQRTVLARRAALVAELYASPPAARVIVSR